MFKNNFKFKIFSKKKRRLLVNFFEKEATTEGSKKMKKEPKGRILKVIIVFSEVIK